MRQYFHTLRLTSELVDLRVGNANLFVRKKLLKFAEQSKAHEQGLSLIDAPPQKQKGTLMGAVSVVEHQGLEPWTDRLYSLRACFTVVTA